jgi:hypothetical protein
MFKIFICFWFSGFILLIYFLLFFFLEFHHQNPTSNKLVVFSQFIYSVTTAWKLIITVSVLRHKLFKGMTSDMSGVCNPQRKLYFYMLLYFSGPSGSLTPAIFSIENWVMPKPVLGGERDVSLIHYPSCADWFKPSRYDCND